MKKNASNIDGFLSPTTNRKRVTLDAVPERKSKVRDGLVPVQNVKSISKKPMPAMHPQEAWTDDLNSSLADLPGYDNFDPEGFVDSQKPDFKKALRNAPKKLKKKFSKKKKILIAVLLTLVLVLTGAFVAFRVLWPDESFLGNWWDVLSSEPLKQDANGRTNVLLFGTAPVDYDGPLLSDTIMVLSVNQTDKTAYMVSLPRDLWVKHYCPNTILGTTAGRLNETFRCALEDDDEANEAAASAEFRDKVGEILGLDVQYHVRLSWDGVIDIVNAVGGIDVTIESQNPKGIYDVATGIKFENGEVAHMDGHLALAFIRARGSAGGYGLEDSNFARERHQQQVIQALQKKALNAGTLANPVAVVNLVQAMGDNIRTNFRTGEIRTVVRLASEFDANNIISLPLVDNENEIYLVTNDNINGASVVVPSAGTFDYSEIKQYIRESMSSDPMLHEKAVVDVLNGAGVEGLAGSEADKIRNEGFRVGKIGNAGRENYTATKIYSLSDDKPATKEALENIYGNVITWDYPFDYSTEADFIVVVGQS